MLNKYQYFLVILLLLVGCTPGNEVKASATSTITAIPTRTPLDSITHSPTSSITVTLKPSQTNTPEPQKTIQPPLNLCSPLEGFTLAELVKIISNPFQAPLYGQDDGHHGVDLAYYSYGERKEMLGAKVYSVLSGKTAAVIFNRQPYGNAVIIETNLNNIRLEWQDELSLPTPAPTISASSRLTCPTATTDLNWTRKNQSLYLLYAHLNSLPLTESGESIQCGQQIGEVGTTGNSVNPHLHLEVRIGPQGARFTSLAHYDASASNQEMANYCLWRINGWFQPIDPMHLLTLR